MEGEPEMRWGDSIASGVSHDLEVPPPDTNWW